MKIRDENNVPKLLEILEELTTSRIEIGVLGQDGGEGDILMVASVNEYGVSIDVTPRMRAYLHYRGLHLSPNTREINIPERSFIRGTFDSRRKQFEDRGARLVEQVITKGMDPSAFFNAYGEYLASQVRDYMTMIQDPSNHPYTEQKKGSSNPLIDTGRLRGAIDWQVVK